MNNPDVILKWTDKGSSLDFMDKSYCGDCLIIKGHLNSHVQQELHLDFDKKVFEKLKLFVENYRSNLINREVGY